MNDAHFPCPECGEHLNAGPRGRWVEDIQGFRRDRACGKGHEYPTIERIPPKEFLRSTQILGSSGRAKYSTDRLQADLSLKLGPVLSKETRNKVVDRVEERLVRNWKSRRAPRRLDGSAISEAVVDVLREFSDERALTQRVGDALRRSHVLYALSQESLRFKLAEPPAETRAAVSLQGDGFAALPGILEWLVDQYPALRRSVRQPRLPHFDTPPIDRWHALPRDAAPTPSHLLRRVLRDHKTVLITVDDSLQTEVDIAEEWETIEFNPQIYSRSLRRAFAGRPDFAHQAEYSAQWVLFALAGQDTVRVSDLVAMTTQCLRRVDAVASLRWAIIAKSLTPAALLAEIIGMLEWPAPRLVFTPNPGAEMRTTSQMLPLGH